MKNLLLNCDQVFEVLTRGPFPSGDPNDECVEHHLRACHECRQLAEALRPAVALLHEAVDREEALDLPEYQGTLPAREPLAPAAERPLAQGLRQVVRPGRANSGKRFDQAVSAVRLIAASLLVAALGTLIYSFATAPASNDRGVSFAMLRSASPPAHLPDGPGLMRLAALKLPARCMPVSYQTLTAEQAGALAAQMSLGSQEALRCCTECHHASTAPQSAESNLVAIAAQNCSACHRG